MPRDDSKVFWDGLFTWKGDLPPHLVIASSARFLVVKSKVSSSAVDL